MITWIYTYQKDIFMCFMQQGIKLTDTVLLFTSTLTWYHTYTLTLMHIHTEKHTTHTGADIPILFILTQTYVLRGAVHVICWYQKITEFHNFFVFQKLLTCVHQTKHSRRKHWKWLVSMKISDTLLSLKQSPFFYQTLHFLGKLSVPPLPPHVCMYVCVFTRVCSHHREQF